MRLVVLVSAVVAIASVAASACAPHAESTPEIVVSPGVSGRFALMERYRLHDEERRAMMQRPRVWVENEPDEDAAPPRDAADAGADEPGP